MAMVLGACRRKLHPLECAKHGAYGLCEVSHSPTLYHLYENHLSGGGNKTYDAVSKKVGLSVIKVAGLIANG